MRLNAKLHAYAANVLRTVYQEREREAKEVGGTVGRAATLQREAMEAMIARQSAWLSRQMRGKGGGGEE